MKMCYIQAIVLNVFFCTACDINTQDFSTAIANKDYVRVQEYLDCGFDIETDIHYGRRPLHLAVLADDPKITELLLARGADINAVDKYGTTPLMYAASIASVSIVQLLLSSEEINITTRDSDGKDAATLAMIAASTTEKEKSLETFRLILESGASKNGETFKTKSEHLISNSFEYTWEHPEYLTLLLKMGFEPDWCDILAAEGRINQIKAADYPDEELVEKNQALLNNLRARFDGPETCE